MSCVLGTRGSSNRSTSVPRTAELTQSVGELRALSEVGQAISSTLDLQTVLSTIVARATQLTGVDAGAIYEYDEQREIFVPRATEQLDAEIVETMLTTPVRKGEGATGRLAEKALRVTLRGGPAQLRNAGMISRAKSRICFSSESGVSSLNRRTSRKDRARCSSPLSRKSSRV
jgi:GAF domain-containing protein